MNFRMVDHLPDRPRHRLHEALAAVVPGHRELFIRVVDQQCVVRNGAFRESEVVVLPPVTVDADIHRKRGAVENLERARIHVLVVVPVVGGGLHLDHGGPGVRAELPAGAGDHRTQRLREKAGQRQSGILPRRSHFRAVEDQELHRHVL